MLGGQVLDCVRITPVEFTCCVVEPFAVRCVVGDELMTPTLQCDIA